MPRTDLPRDHRKPIPPENRLLLDADHVARLLSVSRYTILAWRKQGLMPQPVEFSAGTVLWRVREIEAWVVASCPAMADWTWRPTVSARLDAYIRCQSREIKDMQESLDAALRAKAAGATTIPVSLAPDSPTL